jgi:CYTH domain-containing protein
VEIERKWLVDSAPTEALAVAAEAIDQGYLVVAEDGGEVRLRRRDKGRFLTVKSGHGLARAEHEIELSEAQFEALWPATEGRRLQKSRRVIPRDGGLAIELDVYAGRHQGLVVAEVEFRDEEAARDFVAPPWFGREVTYEEGFKNRRLACG